MESLSISFPRPGVSLLRRTMYLDCCLLELILVMASFRASSSTGHFRSKNAVARSLSLSPTASGIYHYQGAPLVRELSKEKYMSQAQAKASGYRASRNGQ